VRRAWIRWSPSITSEGGSLTSGAFRPTTLRLENTFGRCRIFRKFFGGASRPSHQLSAAIGTYAFEDRGRTVTAECAFKRADERIRGFRRKVTITTFTIGPQLEHVDSFSPHS